MHFRYGERLRVILVNDTMMTHPMHMHGMWQELEDPEGRFQARKHTISVQPAQRVAFLVTANALGDGRGTAICFFTCLRACSAKSSWPERGATELRRGQR